MILPGILPSGQLTLLLLLVPPPGLLYGFWETGFGVCQEWRLRNGSEWSYGREGEIMTTGNGCFFPLFFGDGFLYSRLGKLFSEEEK
jgi:hypothetical protein